MYSKFNNVSNNIINNYIILLLNYINKALNLVINWYNTNFVYHK